MSKTKTSSTYIHTGSALALGGHLSHPFPGPIPSQGECVVPSCGGVSHTSVGPFDYEGIVSFEAARVQCLANEERKGKTIENYTLSTVVIEGLNIGNVVTAARVTARLLAVASMPPGDKGKPKLRFSTLGSSFSDLRIPLCKEPLDIGEMGGLAPTSAAKMKRRHRGVVEIPDFGTVFLAEFFPGPYSARLTMVRVALGCPVGGTMNLGEVKDGGNDWP